MDLWVLPIPLSESGPNVNFPTGPFAMLLKVAYPLHPPGGFTRPASGRAQIQPKGNDLVYNKGRFDLGMGASQSVFVVCL
jgi:hypothetical protein